MKPTTDADTASTRPASAKRTAVKKPTRAAAGKSPGRAGKKSASNAAIAANSFAPIRPRRVFEEICDHIRARISSGEFRPGDKLPSERDLAAALKVGRSALREALRTLENAGILVLRKGAGGGAFVQQGDPHVLNQSLTDLMHLGRIPLQHMIEARSIITGAVVKIACERGSEADFDAIEATLRTGDEVRHGGDVRQVLSVGTEFYRMLAAATHNEALILLVDALSQIIRHVLLPLGLGHSERSWELRWSVLKHLRARDAKKASRDLQELFLILERVYALRASQGSLE